MLSCSSFYQPLAHIFNDTLPVDREIEPTDNIIARGYKIDTFQSNNDWMSKLKDYGSSGNDNVIVDWKSFDKNK